MFILIVYWFCESKLMMQNFLPYDAKLTITRFIAKIRLPVQL